jgi:hypothetical protein
MNPSSPPSAAPSGESPHPSLSPISDASSTGMERRKTALEIIVEAFGGDEHKLLWPFRGPWRPGISPRRAATQRVSKKTPPGHSSPDCLRCWGLEKNAATRELFYLAENYARLFEGRIIVGTLAKKWIANVFKKGTSRKFTVAGEELNKNEGNCVGQFLGASLRYFPVVPEDSPGDLFVYNQPSMTSFNGCHLGRSRKVTLVSFMEQALDQ